jgi:magnesium-transporting ATPase (P-type)
VGKPTVEEIITLYDSYKNIENLKKNPHLIEAVYFSSEPPSEGEGIIGNGTERALQGYFGSYLPDCNRKIVKKLPFSSDKKYSMNILDNGIRVYKGAPEILIRDSVYQLDHNGEREGIKREGYLSEYKRLASSGKRVIAVAIDEGHPSNMTLCALISLKDKVRRGTREAVEEVENAGVKVIMIT